LAPRSPPELSKLAKAAPKWKGGSWKFWYESSRMYLHGLTMN